MEETKNIFSDWLDRGIGLFDHYYSWFFGIIVTMILVKLIGLKVSFGKGR